MVTKKIHAKLRFSHVIGEKLCLINIKIVNELLILMIFSVQSPTRTILKQCCQHVTMQQKIIIHKTKKTPKRKYLSHRSLFFVIPAGFKPTTF